MAIYTKTGDSGETGLFDGRRVGKGDPRIDLLGDLDELNAHVGLLITYLKTWKNSANLTQYNSKFLDFHLRFLEIIQSSLFDVGAEIANPELKNREPSDYNSVIRRLEAAIDVMERDLPTLTKFILPGGSAGAAYAHICRSVARKVERKFYNVIIGQTPNESMAKFLNRLSDYLFMLARFLNKQSGAKETVWQG